MRLSKIKLAGFKSFVDPTTISFPSNLVGVVGPNGCGKSNVIDAVRWVMGESSASRLRGDSMTDVIFNGSSARQPVGTASVELLFDNSDGTVGGQYAKYSELSIRRSVSREGLSTYYLNGTKCRRKDITGIFMGTGLGPRSYSIIEQGMISRIIEAKPEEMRVYIEEAAGISRYKERRRETETRIRHTRENLERLTDLLEEVEKQIKHLDRQAKAAERYKKHKAEERRTAAELLGLRLREFDERTEEHERMLAECETRLQAAIAEQRSAEAMIEETRDSHTEATDGFNEVQGRFYKVGAEIARLEQAIEHGRELRERQLADLEQAREGATEILEHIEKDESELEQLQLALNELAPGLQQAQAREQRSGESLRRAEAAMAEWRERWEAVNSELHEAQQTSEVEAARIEQFESLAARLDRQHEKITGDSEEISLDSLRQTMAEVSGESAARASAVHEADERLAGAKSRIERARERERRLASELQQGQTSLQTTIGRYSAAKALQDAALGENGSQTGAWLSESGFAKRPRLAQQLQVEAGWERAVETVLGDYLQAVSVDSLDDAARKLHRLTTGSVVLMQASQPQSVANSTSLAAKVRHAPAAVLRRLSEVRTAASLQAGLSARGQLQDGESLVTQEGEWISRDFLRVNRPSEEAGGVLERVKELRALRDTLKQQEEIVAEAEKALSRARAELKSLEDQGDKAQSDAATVHRAHSELAAQADTARFRVTAAEQRWLSFQKESRDIEDEVSSTSATLNQSQQRLTEARANVLAQSERRALLESQRDQLSKELERVGGQASEDREATKEVAIRYETRLSSKESASQTLLRMQSQLAQFQSREETLTAQIDSEEAPLAEKSEQLESELGRRVSVEQELSGARKQLDDIDSRLRELEQQRGGAEDRVAERREASNVARMSAQETRVRREGIFEQFKATGFTLAETLAELAADATVEVWEENLTRLIRRIERLGPINLAAIDEFKEQSERKEYLDAQLADLNSALETLENAIRKIDRETRTRFKETYDKIDSGFKRLFPKLFGGGHAYLELTGDDLLSAGVTVMARPPGKRNSTIHLLSGGEKALTAVALVFAIFELNPAPFCLLDEVDAPLDDANVTRYCEIVKEMSEHVQFVFITHNKVTMEMARQLSGVTMQEPGVSRMVTVDLDEAVQMAVS